MYFVAGTRTQKARAMCCRILVTLVVAAVRVASPLLMLPLIIATFSGFKLGGGYRFELKLKVNCFWCLPDSLTFLRDVRRTVITWKGLKYWFCVYVGGRGWGGGCFVACASTILFNIDYLYVLKERFSVRHTENCGTTVHIEFIYVMVIVRPT